MKGLPSILYPTRIYVEAKRGDMMLKLTVDVTNPCEIPFKLGRTGMIEGPCMASGTFSWEGNTVDLNGYGMFEATRVKYLIQLPGIIPRIMQKIFSRAK